MIPRRIPFNQIAFATLVGVGGGIYIYRPMFESHRRNTSEGKKAEAENKGQNNMDK
ncbi:protein PIGBOS1 [Neoarius graeffei]|uniref:protein PIGBOS1 n=1 Tax=Neoarius graeffei TaxID=443677 RepID=UPI00298D2980|nr:protein PIGBOS1 [Neoarius graeffei]